MKFSSPLLICVFLLLATIAGAVPNRKVATEKSHEENRSYPISVDVLKKKKSKSAKKLSWKEKMLTKIIQKKIKKKAKKKQSKKKEKNPFNLSSFILSIIGIISFYSGGAILLGLIAAFLAVILGVIGLCHNRKHREFGILGIIMGALPLLIMLHILIFGFY